MVNKELAQERAVTTALKYLRRMTNAIFASRMQRAATKISASQRVFRRTV
jgi:hypothetical protein